MPELIKVVDGVARAYSHEQFRGDYKTTGSARQTPQPTRCLPGCFPALSLNLM